MLLTSWLRQLPGLMARRAGRGLFNRTPQARAWRAKRSQWTVGAHACGLRLNEAAESLEERALLTPSLLSITRQDPTAATTSADSLVFRATFSEAVTGVDVDDFVVNGNTSAAVTAVSGSGAVYDITVSGGNLATFEGTVGLNVALSTITIPDSGLVNPYPLKRTVSGVSGTITDLNVRINNLTHTWPDDLEALLVAPSGEKSILFADAGHRTRVVNLTFTLDDSAATEIPDDETPVATSYRPGSYGDITSLSAPAPSGPYSASLATFNGINPNGVWQLFLGDDSAEDRGTLGGFTLIITTANGTTEFTTANVTINAVSNNSALPTSEPATDEVYTLDQPLADFQVTTLDDEDDGQTTQDADLSLREAIRLANADANASTITFAPSLFTGGDQTIVLSLFDTGLDSGEFGPSAFIVSTDIDILGPTGNNGLTIERNSGASNFRLFQVQSAGNLTLDSLTLSGGRAIGLQGSGGGGSSAGMGGAIFNQGTLNVRGSLLVGHVAAGAGKNIGGSLNEGGAGVGSIASGTTGGGPNGGNATSSAGGFGGGGGVISNVGGPGGFGAGGGGGTATAGNGGFGGGGGGAHTGGTPGTGGFGGGNGTAGNSNPFGGNTSFGGGGAGMGGAIFNLSGTVNITNSTLTANSAFNSGGSVLDGKGLGGALFTVNGTTTINSSTLNANRADNGGAVYAFNNIFSFQGIPGGLQFVTINNSILANSLNGATDFASDKVGLISPALSGVGNLIESNATTNGFAGTIVSSADPNLAALADNGGPTQTFALNAGSPAIDAGDSVAGAAAGDFDQRGDGFGRITGDGIDIGAFEAQIPPSDSFIVTTLDDEDDADTSDLSDLSLREAIRLANADANDSVITFDPNLLEGPAEIVLGGTQLTISSNVTITGLGARTLAISGNNASRVFLVDDGSAATNATVAISGLSITDGAADNGAGIFNKETLTLTAIAIQDNASTDSGAGLFNNTTGNLTVRDSTIRNNIASTSGGGIANVQGQLTVLNSTISSNTAQKGGGLYEIAGTVGLKNVTITGNSATTGAGGGLLIEADGVEMHNTIVAGNTAANGGNDISDPLGMANGGLSAASSHNVVGDPAGFDALTDGTNFNRIGDGSGGVRPIGTILNTSIANNGGPTDTHALVTGSIALDNGDNSIATAAELTTDQRGEGFARIRYGKIDIGAFEFFVTPTLDVTLSSGTLTVTDGDETGINNDLTIETTETDVIISDATESFDPDAVALISGATLSNKDRTLTIPLASISAGITIDGALGTDTLTVLHTLLGTLNFTGKAESITVESPTESTLEAANVTLVADAIDITTVIDVGTGTVTLQPQTAGQLINLGGADAANTLGLTDAELDFITAGKVVIGNSDSGTITVSSDIDLTDTPTVSTLHLNTAAAVTSTAGGLKVSKLAVTAGGAVTLTDSDTAIGTLAVTTSGVVTVTQAGDLTINDVAGVSGINNTSGSGGVSLTSTAGKLTSFKRIESKGELTLTAEGDVGVFGTGSSNELGTANINVTSNNGAATVSNTQSQGDVTVLAKNAVSVTSLGIEISGSTGKVSLTSTNSTVTVTAGGVTGRGDVTVSAAGDINVSGLGINNTGGTGSVSATTTVGTLTVESSGIQSKGAVTVSAPGLVQVKSAGINNSTGSGNVSVTSTGAGVATTSGGISSSGDVTISAAGDMTLAAINNSTGTGKVEIATTSGKITTNSGTITSKGNVSFNAPGLITIGSGGVDVTSSSTEPTVTVTSTTAGITVTSGGIQGKGAVSLLAAGDILVAVGGIVNTSGIGKIDVVTSSGAVMIESTGLQSKGNVKVQGTGLITVKNSGIGVTGSDAATVSVTTSAGGVAVSGSGIQGKGDITLSAAGNITSTSSGISNSTGTGKISLTTTGGGISSDILGIQSTGDISLSAAGNISIIDLGASNTSGTGKIDIVTSVGTVTITGIGVSSKGNITVSAPGAIDISQGGVSVGSSTAATIAISSTGANGSITNGTGGNITGKGNVTLTANQMQLGGTVSASNGSVTLQPATNATAIDLGTNTSGKLSLTDAELDFVTASTVIIGNANSGAITISAPLDQPTINTLQLNGNTTFAAGGGYTFQIGGTTAGTQFDQIKVNGTVTINSTATLATVVANSFVVGATDTFAVLLNDDEDAISGTFSGLPNNGSIADFLGSGTPGAVRYDAGTGNDLVIAKNQTPVVSPVIADQSPDEDAEFTLSVGANFSDPDVNDTLTFTATKANGDALPEWLSFDDETQQFSGTPTNDDVGSFDVKVTATDPKSASISDTFTITVINTNDLPTITADKEGVVATGGSATNSGTWDDVDVGDTVALTASVGNVVKNDDGTWSWSGTITGSTNVTITATDESDATDTVTFRVGVPGTKVTGANGVIGVDDAANDGSPTNDNLRVYIENGKVYLQDLTNGIIAVSGSTQIDPFTVELDDFDKLTFNGTTGDDKLTLDFRNGNPIPSGGMVFNGGAGFDSLAIEGLDEEFDSYTVNYSNLTDGNVQFRDGSAVQSTLTFLGIDPLTIDGTPTDVIFNLPNTNDTGVLLSAVDANTMYLSGNTFEDTTFSIAAATSITINANGGNDSITVSSVASNYTGLLILNGGEGNDVINSSANFAVTLTGGNGNDRLSSGDQNDRLEGQAGKDTLSAGAGDDLLLGGSGNDSLDAGSGDDELSGGAGNDILDGNVGTDCLLETITGNVTITNTSITGLGTDTIVRIECFDITGDDRNNLLDASKFTLGTLHLRGAGGNDTLIGGSGNDELDGGNGFDTAKLVVLGNQSISDTELVSAAGGTDQLISIEGTHLVATGSAGARLDASGFSGNTTLEGGAGNDTLIGGGGVNSINGNAGHDSIVGGEHDESLLGGTGNDTIRGQLGNDTIRGGAGDDSLLGNEGDDRMFGDDGNDRIFGGNGQDSIDGGNGNDTILGEIGHDTIFGGSGHDAISGGDGDDRLNAGGGNNTLLGGGGNDVLWGLANGGRDLALGESGDDTITSGSSDTISGGPGTDLFNGPHAKIDEAFMFDFGRLLG